MDERYISELAFDAAMARLERTISRLWITCIILIIALIGTNFCWLYYESQYENVVTVEQKADWDDGNVLMNGTGEVSVNGEGVSENH